MLARAVLLLACGADGLAALGTPFRAAQRELMDAGAAMELAGDALLADARVGDFVAQNLALRTPLCRAGVAVKNSGRALADVGAKFRNRGGLELAAYAMAEAAAEMADAAALVGKIDGGGGGAAPAAAAAARVGRTLEACGAALVAAAPAETAAALGGAAAACDALEAACAGRPDLAAAAPDLARSAAALRAGGAALGGGGGGGGGGARGPASAAPRPRRW